MNRLFNYFANHLAATILLVLLILLVFDVAFAFIGEVADIGRGQYEITHLFQVIGLTLPRRIYELFPMAALIGAMLGIGNLASQGELVAARAAGLSRSRLAGWVVVTGLMLYIPASWLGEYLAPAAERQANLIRTQALFDRVAVQNDQGVWIRDGARYLRIGAVSESALLQDIEIYEFTADHQLIHASKIASASHDNTGWQLRDLKQTNFRPDRIDVIKTSRKAVQELIDPAMVRVLAREPEHMTLKELQRYIQYLKTNQVGSSHYQLDYWARLARPLTVLAMLLLGIGFVLGTKQRQSRGWRLFMGVLAGLMFKLFNDLFAQAGLVYGVPPLLSAVVPTLVVGGLAVWMFRWQSKI
ncbi:MAG: LPS export ABC transporter permease LptG [Gammaproteobacteria bacterium]